MTTVNRVLVLMVLQLLFFAAITPLSASAEGNPCEKPLSGGGAGSGTLSFTSTLAPGQSKYYEYDLGDDLVTVNMVEIGGQAGVGLNVTVYASCDPPAGCSWATQLGHLFDTCQEPGSATGILQVAYQPCAGPECTPTPALDFQAFRVSLCGDGLHDVCA